MVANLEAALETETETVFTKTVGLWLRIYATVASLPAALETVAATFLMNATFLASVANLETEFDTDAESAFGMMCCLTTEARRDTALDTEAANARLNVILRTTLANLL